MEVAQVNVVDVNEVLSRQAELETALSAIVADKGLDLFLFVVTDILNSNSVVVAIGPRAAAVESAYGVTLENSRAHLRGVVSRKAQIIPALTETVNRG